MRRFLSALGRFLKRLVVALALLVIGALFLTGSQARFIFTEKIPPILTEWEIGSVYNNYIGGPITVVFRIYAPARAWVDLSLIPEIGETVDLWRIVPQPPVGWNFYGDGGDGYYENPNPGYSSNGEFEVQNRVIREEFRGGQRVIEATYTFLYLDPIDFEKRFTEKVARSPNVHIRYFYSNPHTGKVGRDFVNTTSQDAEFYLVRRVEEGDGPIPDLMLMARAVSPLPHYLRLVAVGLVVGTFAVQGWSGIRRRIIRRSGSKLALISSASLGVVQLYESWQKNEEYQYFLEAIRIYRQGFWGRPRPLDWVRTTFILYSGRVVSASQIKEIFEYLVSLESEKAVEEVQRESVP